MFIEAARLATQLPFNGTYIVYVNSSMYIVYIYMYIHSSITNFINCYAIHMFHCAIGTDIGISNILLQ